MSCPNFSLCFTRLVTAGTTQTRTSRTLRSSEASSLSFCRPSDSSLSTLRSVRTQIWPPNTEATRMHSSRMRTIRCSGHRGEGGVCPDGRAAVWGVCPGGCAQCPGGVCPGGCLPRGCLPRGCVCPGGCLPGGVSAQGDVCQGGVSPVHAHPPVNRMTDACENITLPQPHCGW